MSFSSRAPSDAWEPVLLPEGVACTVWVWYRPPHAPEGFVIQVPEETSQSVGAALTMRNLLTSADIGLHEVATWTIHGIAYDAMGGGNPLLDHPLPYPAPPNDPGILVLMRPLPVPPVHVAALAPPFAAAPMAAFPVDVAVSAPVQVAASRPAAAPANAHSEAIFAAIAADWQAILLAEANLTLVRQQLNGLQSRLGSLNRDLSTDEKRASDTVDRREWQDARRWLRDAAGLVSRHLRDHDIGITSAAGNRNRFETLYEEWVALRRPFEGMEKVQKEFEVHRRAVQTLLSNMQSALSNATRDGEQKAQQVMSRIVAKVRNAKAKR